MNRPDAGGEHILVVDDDDVFRDVLGRALRRRGYQVWLASDARQAVAVADVTPLDYVILDLRLEHDSGLSLIARLTAGVSQPRIVMLTGYASIATAVEAIKLGATHYLAKPAQVDEIIGALSRCEGDTSVAISTTPPSVDRLEWEHIQKVLAHHEGNISATARALKMHRRTLQRKLGKRPVKE